jgi:lipoprotein-releasing system ATP-binding protein
MTITPAIEARDVTRILPGEVPVTLVREVDVIIQPGELVAVRGPSGSGKSSLLYLLGLLDRPTAGSILIEGRETERMDEDDLAEVRLERLGFVFQFHFLLPEFSVLKNVMIPMRRLGRFSSGDMRSRAMSLIAALGLEAERDKHPDQLSGGQRQRTAIARALANDPSIILADEPTGNLDTKNGTIVFDIFSRLAREEGRTVVTVTHDPTLAARCDREIHIVDGRVGMAVK